MGHRIALFGVNIRVVHGFGEYNLILYIIQKLEIKTMKMGKLTINLNM